MTLNRDEAKAFFLRHDSYCTIDMPKYFRFNTLLKGVSDILTGKNLTDFRCNSPKFLENVNYRLLGNKDGKFSWRQFELIHPAIYVSLVNIITN